MADERWLPVVGYEGCYEVSDHGRVRSVAHTVVRRNGRPQRINGKIVSQHHYSAHRGGRAPYLHVTLVRSMVYRHFAVHRLMLEAFVGPCPDGMEGCHRNDVGDDNRLENLRWDTPEANQHDCAANGRHANSKKTHCKRGHEFTSENTRWVRRRNGRKFRVCRSCANPRQLKRYHEKRLAS